MTNLNDIALRLENIRTALKELGLDLYEVQGKYLFEIRGTQNNSSYMFYLTASIIHAVELNLEDLNSIEKVDEVIKNSIKLFKDNLNKLDGTNT